jgi:hypothetical protein
MGVAATSIELMAIARTEIVATETAQTAAVAVVTAIAVTSIATATVEATARVTSSPRTPANQPKAFVQKTAAIAWSTPPRRWQEVQAMLA